MKNLLATFALYLFSTVASAQVFQYYGPAAGVQKNTGSTYQNTSAASSDIAALWTGTNCGTTTNAPLLNGNCATVVSSTANPSAAIGLTAVNGTATTAMTSDSAPALSQAISPTWTGTHLFNGLITSSTGTSGVTEGRNGTQVGVFWINSTGAANSKVWDFSATTTDLQARTLDDAFSSSHQWLDITRSGITQTAISLGNSTDKAPITLNGATTIPAPSSGPALTSTGVATSYAGKFIGSSTTGQSLGVLIQGGTNSSDAGFAVQNQSGGSTFFETFGDGGVTVGAPTGGDCGLGCLNAQSLRVNNALVTSANPSATIGLSAVNGSATSFMRSDSAPSLSQAIIPTWTGVHTFTGGGGTSTSVSVGTTGSQGVLCVGNTTCNGLPTSGDPAHAFEVVSNGGSLQGVRFMTYASGAAAITPLHWSRADGTQASPTALVSGDNIMSVGARGYTGATAGMSGSAIAIEGTTIENWSNTANGTKLELQTTPAGQDFTHRTDVLSLTNSLAEFFNQLEIQSTGQILNVNTTTAHGGGQNFIRFTDPTNNMGYVGFAGSDNTMYIDNQLSGTLHLKTNDTDAVIVGSDQGITIGSPTGGDKGAATLNIQGDIFINNVVQKIASLSATCTSGGCTATITNGFSSTVTRSGTGSYSATFSPAFGGTPVCISGTSATASATSSILSVSNTGVSVGTAVTGTATDENFNLICNGT